MSTSTIPFPNRLTSTGAPAMSSGSTKTTRTPTEKRGYLPGRTTRGANGVAAEPERYLEIPGLDHGEHHEILRRFLRSDWTGDDARCRRADEAYSGSIGRWKRDVGDEGAVHAFHAFQEERIVELAEEFLRKNTIVPEWRCSDRDGTAAPRMSAGANAVRCTPVGVDWKSRPASWRSKRAMTRENS